MHGLNLDPPTSSFQSLPDQIRIVAIANDELVAVLNIRILKWYLAYLSLEHSFFLRSLHSGSTLVELIHGHESIAAILDEHVVLPG